MWKCMVSYYRKENSLVLNSLLHYNYISLMKKVWDACEMGEGL